MMSAIAGSGKDTYIKTHLNHLPVISLDDIRKEYHIKPTDKVGNGHAVQIAKERAKEYMRKHESFVWNATNITRQMRSQLIDLFESYKGRVHIVYIEVPYVMLKAQNNNREEALPDDAIERMIRKWEPPTRKECVNLTQQIESIYHP